VLDGAYIERGCIVAANAVVPLGMRVEKNSLVAGVPAKVIRKDEKMIEAIRRNARIYMELAERYLQGEFSGGQQRDK